MGGSFAIWLCACVWVFDCLEIIQVHRKECSFIHSLALKTSQISRRWWWCCWCIGLMLNYSHDFDAETDCNGCKEEIWNWNDCASSLFIRYLAEYLEWLQMNICMYGCMYVCMYVLSYYIYYSLVVHSKVYMQKPWKANKLLSVVAPLVCLSVGWVHNCYDNSMFESNSKLLWNYECLLSLCVAHIGV